MPKLLRSLLSFAFLLVAPFALSQITPSADSYTVTSTPNANYGGSGQLNVQSPSATSFIRFDLGSIPAGYDGSKIAKATLKLYVNSLNTAGSFNVDYVIAPWSESTIRANLAPAIGGPIVGGVAVTTAQRNDYVLIDVTSAVGAWLSGTQANYGIALVPTSPVNVSFQSKENTNASHPPELDIVFASTGAQGPAGPQGVQGPQGSQGPIGPFGPQGIEGPPGSTGATGAAGAQGPQGLMGFTGPQGAQGPIGSTGPGAALVYDSNNTVVGTLLAQNQVLVNVNGHSAMLNFNANGFQEIDASNFQFPHLTSDCSGPRYLDATSVPTSNYLVGGVLYYPSGPSTSLTINSVETFNSGDNVSLPGACFLTFPGQGVLSPAATFNISTLALVPPFVLH